ncbi:type II toxin-antitoxin system RelE/ParE family toxin [Cyanothece sp. BG0011]|uniref:type II toxin-antitoxin system RelE/ParE family toxin n=1 Tax=Cyanothece sp. BG0011 TaxID=2082950 RepID=UPI000D1E4F51|nr:type II toxin-antitoxin system RelE/ParE family toxin [Cyanothece sp. BG0011]
MNKNIKPVEWLGTSLDNLKKFPQEVQSDMGYALYLAQTGMLHSSCKPLKGFKGAGVIEIVENCDGNAYRAVYTVKLEGVIYVLHAFQKKSKQGITTPKQEMDLVKRRLKQAQQHYQTYYAK